MSDIGDWFKSIPFITRYWFASSIAVPLIGKLGLISPAHLVLWPEAFFHKFQVSLRKHVKKINMTVMFNQAHGPPDRAAVKRPLKSPEITAVSQTALFYTT